MIKVNDEDFPWSEGLTVAGLLQAKKYTYPAIIVSINGRHVPEEKFDRRGIADGDSVRVIHLVAGG